MIEWFEKSISRKIASSYVVIFFITYSLFALVIFTLISQTVRQTEAKTLTQVANQKLGEVAASLEALNTNLTAWSRLEVMNDIFSGDIDKRISRTLSQLQYQYALGGQVYVFDAKGVLVASSSPVKEGIFLPQEWAARDSDEKFTDVHLNPLGEIPGISEEKNSIISLSHKIYPDFDRTTQIGTIVATQPWHELCDVIFAGDVPALLFRNSDNQILHSSNSLLDSISDIPSLTEKPATLKFSNQPYISGYADRQLNNIAGWSVVVLRTVEDSNIPLWDIATKLLLLGIALLVPVGLIIRWISLMLTRPLQSLEETVSRVARDKDLSVRSAITTQDEIGVLAQAFNDMAENLDTSAIERENALKKLELLNLTLENRVLARTCDLKAANDEMSDALDQLKSTQSQLVHSEKMASLGQMVAGVAHELNNPIGFIYANFPHLKDYTNEIFELLDEIRSLDMPEASKQEMEAKITEYELDFVKDDLHKIIKSGLSGASRIKNIVASLRSFSRLDESEMKDVRIEDGIDDTLSILNHYLKGRIEVEKHYSLNQPIACRAGQINQVFTNIIFNAIQSIDGKGKLTIATRCLDDKAQIQITDTGPGIPEDIIQQIFDPFFTTKNVGEGTGLGLSISYGIIENHGGTLEVSSIEGEGATFVITIPLSVDKTVPLKGMSL